MSARRSRLQLISLEAREVPAALIDSSTILYQDFDGDAVTVKLSKPLLTSESVASNVFTFDGGAVDGVLSFRQQLESIDLTALGTAAKGIGVTLTASRTIATGGDGFGAIGTINATGFDIGNVNVDGDLGDIHAGDSTLSTPAAGLIKVNSMGRFATHTGGTLASVLNGKVGGINIKTSALGVSIRITGDATSSLGSLTIGGSLVGGLGAQSGYIHADGKIGPVVVGGNLIGNGNIESGTISSTGAMGNVTIKGSLLGGAGQQSGAIFSDAGMGIVKITGDLIGDGPMSASVRTGAGAVSVNVGGSLLGGDDESAALRFLGDVGPVTIGHDLLGGGVQSARISARKLGNVVIGGSIVGSNANDSGQVNASQGIGTVTVKGDVRGGDGQGSGAINSGIGLGKVTILGSLIGGDGTSSAQVSAAGDIGGVSITGNMRGGAGDNSARLLAGGRLLNLTVGGSILGAAGLRSANIVAGKDIGPITVKGSIDGSAGRVLISAVGAPTPTLTTDVAINKITVTGDVIRTNILAGFNTLGTGVNADAQIGAVSVGCDWVESALSAGVSAGVNGTFGDMDDLMILEPNSLPNVVAKITSIKIGGQVIGQPFLSPVGSGGFLAQQIGSCSVGGTAIALNSGSGNDLWFIGRSATPLREF